MPSPRSARPLTARALRCRFRLRRRSDPRGSRSLLQPHQLHRFPIIARRLWNRNVYSCIDGCIGPRRLSDAGASVDNRLTLKPLASDTTGRVGVAHLRDFRGRVIPQDVDTAVLWCFPIGECPTWVSISSVLSPWPKV